MARKEHLLAEINVVLKSVAENEALGTAMQKSQQMMNEKRTGAGGSNSSAKLLARLGSDPFALSRSYAIGFDSLA